jgi:hypothetical protein
LKYLQEPAAQVRVEAGPAMLVALLGQCLVPSLELLSWAFLLLSSGRSEFCTLYFSQSMTRQLVEFEMQQGTCRHWHFLHISISMDF